MPDGPTVRGILRERERSRGSSTRRLSRYSPRSRRQRAPDRAREPLPPPPPARFFVPDVHLGPPETFADESCCPIDMAGLLGLASDADVVVIRGRIMSALAEAGGGPSGGGGRESSWQLKPAGSLEGRLEAVVKERYSRVLRWFSRDHANRGRYGHLDTHGTLPTPDQTARILQFIHHRVIPRLSDRPSPVGASRKASALPPRGANGKARSFRRISLDAFDDYFGFVAGKWHELVPFYGTHDIGTTFRFKGGRFTAVRSDHQSKALARYDAMLEDTVREALPNRAEQAASTELYRSGSYALIRTPLGKHFLCRRVPPYALESESGLLFYFDAVEVGIEISATRTEEVIVPNIVLATHPYRHMFISNLESKHIVCMPRPKLYYHRLHQLPLEEAMLEHLESARMTLCAGYGPNNSGFHPIDVLGREVISEEEAKARRVPIYPFSHQRQRRKHRPV